MAIKKFPVLYKYTEKRKIQQWQIIVDLASFYTIEGIKGGKLTTSKPTLCFAKNVGKKNETSPGEQALLEAAAKHKKKIEKGYALKVEDSGVKYFVPMLAESYKDKKTDKKQKWVDEVVWNSGVRVFVQPKLDGIRTINDGGLTSRDGKPFVTCPHLVQDVFILDGELYNHEFKEDFNAIASMIKGSKPTPEDLEHTKKMAQMWVYDMPSCEGTFSQRYRQLEHLLTKMNTNPGLILVPTYEVKSEKELKEYHKKFLKEGYEGTMIRLDKVYENKRTKSLIKYKDWIDEEFVIVDAVEGEGGRTGTIGKFILQHDINPDQTFSCNVKGNFKYLTEIWQNRDMYIGKEATVQYKNRTPTKRDGKGNVPRHGYVIKIDRKSYE